MLISSSNQETLFLIDCDRVAVDSSVREHVPAREESSFFDVSTGNRVSLARFSMSFIMLAKLNPSSVRMMSSAVRMS